MDQRNCPDGSASSFDDVAADNALDRPIATFHQHIRLQRRNQIQRVRLGKHHDVIDAAEGRDAEVVERYQQ